MAAAGLNIGADKNLTNVNLFRFFFFNSIVILVEGKNKSLFNCLDRFCFFNDANNSINK